MDVTTHTFQHSPLPVRMIAGSEGAPSRLGRPAVSPSRRYCVSYVEIFKKTPCAADLKPAGRDVAKDMLELDSMSMRYAIESKISGERPAARRTGWQLCATSHMPKVIWKIARQDEAVTFAAVGSGRAHEKQRYADF